MFKSTAIWLLLCFGEGYAVILLLLRFLAFTYLIVFELDVLIVAACIWILLISSWLCFFFLYFWCVYIWGLLPTRNYLMGEEFNSYFILLENHHHSKEHIRTTTIWNKTLFRKLLQFFNDKQRRSAPLRPRLSRVKRCNFKIFSLFVKCFDRTAYYSQPASFPVPNAINNIDSTSLQDQHRYRYRHRCPPTVRRYSTIAMTSYHRLPLTARSLRSTSSDIVCDVEFKREEREREKESGNWENLRIIF